MSLCCTAHIIFVVLHTSKFNCLYPNPITDMAAYNSINLKCLVFSLLLVLMYFTLTLTAIAISTSKFPKRSWGHFFRWKPAVTKLHCPAQLVPNVLSLTKYTLVVDLLGWLKPLVGLSHSSHHFVNLRGTGICKVGGLKVKSMTINSWWNHTNKYQMNVMYRFASTQKFSITQKPGVNTSQPHTSACLLTYSIRYCHHGKIILKTEEAYPK